MIGSWSTVYTHNAHETPAGGEVGVGLGGEHAENVVVLPVSSAIDPSMYLLALSSPRAPARRSSSSLEGPTTLREGL
jgi:hypothetical protein